MPASLSIFTGVPPYLQRPEAFRSALVAVSAVSATAAAATVVRTGLCHVDLDRATLQVFFVQGIDGSLSFGIIRHLNKAESFCSASVPVSNDIHGIYCTVCFESGSKIALGRVKVHVSYINLHLSLLKGLNQNCIKQIFFRKIERPQREDQLDRSRLSSISVIIPNSSVSRAVYLIHL